MASILVVDDDPGFRSLLETILKGEGYHIFTAGTCAEARRLGNERAFDLVLSDLKLPDGDGIQVLRYFAEHAPETPLVMITAFGTVPTAVEAMKLGAADYLGKPLRSPDELRVLVRRTLESRRIAREHEYFREQQSATFSCDNLIAEDARMKSLLEMARKVAPTDATVLIMGETGTGKEVLARCIHAHSARKDRVFVPVNCAALSPTLIESELFGHEKGAFTGAVAQHIGRFERANGGTLFLDEIGELDFNLQSKLLRVLQERTFERVGGKKTIEVDVRLIAATNRNLKQLASEGKFREDLYYRLNIFPLEIPALRQRPSDISRLARFFLDRAARKLGKQAPVLSSDALAALGSYAWPGNVRELENMMERMAILCDREVKAGDLPFSPSLPSRHAVTWKDIERQAIEEALQATGGNRTKAAQRLGISLRTLQYRLKEYGQEEET